MTATIRRRGPDVAVQALWLLLGMSVPVVGWLALWCTATAAALVTGTASPPFPPRALVRGLSGGGSRLPAPWSWAAPTGAALFTVVTTAVPAKRLLARTSASVQGHIDRAARAVQGATTVRDLSRARAAAEARRLAAPVEPPGMFLGRAVTGGRPLWAPWEQTHVDIWGPRTGKTTTRVIPAVAAAPGVAVVTSNKLDVLHATRAMRERRGPVWIYDPQRLTGEPQRFWWDILDMVEDHPGSAAQVASLFAAQVRQPHQRSDGFFEPAGEVLVTCLLLAAKASGSPITAVRRWLKRPDDTTPEAHLRGIGLVATADTLAQTRESPPEQRAGIYGVALQMTAFLDIPSLTQWITPQPGIPKFDFLEFVRLRRGTMYIVQRADDKFAAPVSLAMTAVLAVTAEGYAKRCANGRVPVPIVFVLDELANLTPWRLWPDKCTHFGSRGVVVMSFFQSWAQGEAVFGPAGMAKLWGAAGVRVYGGGSVETGFVGDVAATAGSFAPHTVSVQRSTGNLFTRTLVHGTRDSPEPVLRFSDLASIPRGRALVIPSGSKPLLVRSVPWWQGPYAHEIHESVTAAEAAVSPDPSEIGL